MCALFSYALRSIISCFHATVEPAACQSGVFTATFLPNGSDKRQQSGRIKAVGCWFQCGQCVGAFT